MKKISKRVATNNFLNFLFELGAQDWRYHLKKRSVGVDKIAKYLLSLDEKDLKRVISDPIWINYKSFKYRPGAGERETLYKDEEWSQNRYGPMLRQAVARILYTDKTTALFFAKHSKGLILNTILRQGYGEVANTAFKKARSSKDARVRNIAAQTGPINKIDKMRFDSAQAVRISAIKRIGINHCYKDHLDDSASRIRAMAMIAAPLSDFDYDAVMTDITNNIGKYGIRWLDRMVAKSILSKVSSEEALYYLHLSGNDSSIKEILEFKMENPS